MMYNDQVRKEVASEDGVPLPKGERLVRALRRLKLVSRLRMREARFLIKACTGTDFPLGIFVYRV